MKNSNLNNEYPDDEIDLMEILRTIYSSKKLIILITLASALLAFIYIAQKESVYQSTVTLEVGSYDLLSGEKKLIEPMKSLIKKLKINQFSKKLDKLSFNSIEDHFLEIYYTSPSPEFNENLLNEAITFAQESHAEILDTIFNNDIELINLNLGALESKNKFLLKLTSEEENNLLKLQFYEQAIELQNEIHNFKQEKEAIEIQIKLANNQTNMTQPIRELVTSEIKPKQLFTILIGTFFGFIFSVLIVFIRQALLKEKN
jgi:LPS O-antigen subunit length determinant protein (WzzB/FepE family)